MHFLSRLFKSADPVILVSNLPRRLFPESTGNFRTHFDSSAQNHEPHYYFMIIFFQTGTFFSSQQCTKKKIDNHSFWAPSIYLASFNPVRSNRARRHGPVVAPFPENTELFAMLSLSLSASCALILTTFIHQRAYALTHARVWNVHPYTQKRERLFSRVIICSPRAWICVLVGMCVTLSQKKL